MSSIPHSVPPRREPEGTEYSGGHPDAVAPDAGYRRSFLDRHGAHAGVIIRTLSYGLPIFLLLSILSGGLAARLHAGVLVTVVLAAVGSLGGTALVLRTILGASNAAGEAVRLVSASGGTTPYAAQFSRQDALVMRGLVREALDSYEQEIASPSRAVDPAEARVRAADLYATRGEDYKRAAELLREVQRLPDVKAGVDIYATNRLIDLLLGPLRDRGRALVELRRLIDRYPTSTAAAHARTALAKLKAGG